ncbi:hypothetical protein [Aquimarina sp. RZ0]|uniref:hypothetical protein n=1 Tax=Aquimarina sp. RZ0 TaxID=2607730 RepID=UPI0011F33232|nr:hypothetical protein [Aquimarina sp. RZ0]KAA1245762.1 hypothetical protein F0000_11010 [Aquimarina sp. RZ0]
MKKEMRWRFGMVLFFSIVLMSCQEEERELIDPTIDDAIPIDSRLANIMKNVVTHDGSFDDIIDKGNCYSINLPYTIHVNEQEKIISQLEDYNQLSLSDHILIEFPITITRHDYEELFIENQQQLDRLAATCLTTDDDIECVDFVYPFRFVTFNPDTNIFNTVEAIHDTQVFGFMEDLEDNTVVAIKYPIQLLVYNNQNMDATHNEELLATILEFAKSCDENDE